MPNIKKIRTIDTSGVLVIFINNYQSNIIWLIARSIIKLSS